MTERARHYRPTPRCFGRAPLWSLTEPTRTDVTGGVQGSLQSGSFSGPVGTGGNVTINMTPPEEPQTAKEYLKAIWLMSLDSERRAWNWRRFVRWWLIVLSIGMLATFGVCAYIFARLGWLW